MDFEKLDPTVAAELEAGLAQAATGEGSSSGTEMAVFVHVADPLLPEHATQLDQRMRPLGLEQPVKPGAVLSMSLPAEQIGRLSEEPWVVAIRAAHRIRPLA
ncbi:MAG: hypothetical protein ACRDT8_02460 [Micromonosporaceae bacterium]